MVRQYLPPPPGGGAAPPRPAGGAFAGARGPTSLGHGGYGQYAALRRRGPRRTTGGTVAGALGSLAAMFVIAILGIAVLGQGDRQATGDNGRSGGEASRSAATANKLYNTGALTPAGCRAPQIAAGDDVSMRRFMEVLTGCLDVSWQRQFAKGDLRFTPPDRVFWSEPGRSPCGSYPQPGAAAFYCPANNAMYVGLAHVVETAGDEPVSNYAVYARVISHEYSHHVQEEAGILAYGHELLEQRDVASRTDASRRIELQAQCFAGVFLGAERSTLPMTARQYLAMITDVLGRGDDEQPPDERDHGSSRHYAGWVEKGFRNRVLSACNTWTAPASTVS
ncbi:neutral zinc metallopeptidase [Actinomadura sp. HBU206391]|uniref:neutral zinc metallopeptidase n=1 Tax=Actinomadura sp. HBU206391 TaxID=2731692 RepID=UPI0016508916|nr:neutral zinc metallopeptidase [Actinomadura sp. HBU206391]MBC6460354.1 neutral zinc metallopeptidase [Actinomadura sp. HBU206391]